MSYLTLHGEAETELIEKKSRFIGRARPVFTEEEAMAFFRQARDDFPDATHHVWAYNLRDGHCRCSDDGEPSGTAGQPVLDSLQKASIENAAVVVTRYFGGILLGAGGLVRAYGKSARDAVAAAGPAEVFPCVELKFPVSYGLYGKVERELPKFHAVLLNSVFGAEVELTVRLRQERESALRAALTEMTGGECVPEQTGLCWSDME